MAELAINFAVSYILTRLSQKDGPRLSGLQGFAGDYGGAIPLILGPENRTGAITAIWATPIVETTHKHKPAFDYVFGLVGALLPAQKTYTYSVSFAGLICGNPVRSIKRLWLNKRLMYSTVGGDVSVEYAALRFYLGTYDQLPDPTIEAVKGMGNVPAYLGSTYFVIDTLQLANFNNGIPNEIEAEVEEGDGSLRRIITTLAAAAGIDTNAMSSTGIDGDLLGLTIGSSVTVAAAFQNLADAYSFDVGDVNGALRFVPRGRYPMSTVSANQLGGYASDQERPEPKRFTRGPEIGLPQEVTVNFSDPARDYQPNSALTKREGGSSQANIVIDSGLTLTADDAQRMADKVMWEAWAQRQALATTTTDIRDDLTAMDVQAFETPTGYDTYRITRRSRGANGVIVLDLAADQPLLYSSTLPGNATPTPTVHVTAAEPINPPVFIEPPASLSGGTAQVWIGVSGGSGVFGSGGSHYLFDPNWPGVSVFVATADVEADYRTAGRIDAPSYMGVLTRPLDITSGANPDIVGVLGLDLTMSGGQLESVSAADAASGGINLVWVESASGGPGEFMTFQTALATMPYVYACTTIYRGLQGSTEAQHDEGANAVVIDDALFRLSLPLDLRDVPLWFKFVQPGQALADVVAYPYVPHGGGFYVAPPTDVTVTPDARVQGDGTSIIDLTISWTASTDPLLDHYAVELSTDGGATYFSAGTAGSESTSITYQPALANTNYIARVTAVSSMVGGVPSTPATSAATSSGALAGGRVITASANLLAGAFVNIFTSGGAIRVRPADATDDSKPADGFVLAAVVGGANATVYGLGQQNTQLAGMTPGTAYFLDASGAGGVAPAAPGASGNYQQMLGKADSATVLTFAPQVMGMGA